MYRSDTSIRFSNTQLLYYYTTTLLHYYTTTLLPTRLPRYHTHSGEVYAPNFSQLPPSVSVQKEDDEGCDGELHVRSLLFSLQLL